MSDDTNNVDDPTAERIGQAFDFLRDVTDEPETLDRIPDGSRLAFREISAGGRVVRLTASSNEAAGAWVARVTRYGVTGGAPVFQRPIADDRGRPRTVPGWLSETVATGGSAAAALDALEERVRAAIKEAIRVDLEAINRR